MTKRAVIVGVNDYSGQNSLPPGWSVGNLGACIADTDAARDLLTSAFGFDAITNSLTDGAATRDAIIAAIQDVLDSSAAGDVACVYYSGHGGRFPADAANPGRYYETIIPASGSPITDLDMFKLASSLDQSTVNFTLILDSCNSGGIHEGTPDSPVRSVSYDRDFVQTCVDTMSTIVPCGVTLADGNALDGNVSGVSGDGNGVVCSVDDNKSFVSLSKSTVLAACRYDETATEFASHGALTQGLLDLVAACDPSITYVQLVDQLRTAVSNMGLTQTPTLLGQTNRIDEVFLAPWTASA